jgi:hypothetical protein
MPLRSMSDPDQDLDREVRLTPAREVAWVPAEACRGHSGCCLEKNAS